MHPQRSVTSVTCVSPDSDRRDALTLRQRSGDASTGRSESAGDTMTHVTLVRGVLVHESQPVEARAMTFPLASPWPTTTALSEDISALVLCALARRKLPFQLCGNSLPGRKQASSCVVPPRWARAVSLPPASPWPSRGLRAGFCRGFRQRSARGYARHPFR